MNNDGKLDMVTARAKKPIFGGKGELLWLEQPSDGSVLQTWKEHILAEGPDVNLLVDITGNGTVEISQLNFL